MRLFCKIALPICLSIIMCSCGVSIPEGKISIRVIDEDGVGVKDAKVTIGFQIPKQGIKDVGIKGLSDATGLFSASHKTMEGIGFVVEKEGYYRSKGGYSFTQKMNRKWQPWNPEVKVLLRRIIRPIPMYAHKLSKMEIPVADKNVGFDLVKYAWVSPYGQGEHADFIFNLKRNYVDEKNFDCSLKIKFNKNDGIQEVKDEYSVVVVNQYSHHSTFKLPRFAPENGYLNELSLPFRYGRGNAEIKDNYIFRVRSKVVGGKVVGMYGKIIGDIMFDPRGSKTASVVFKYYLNPDYTTNLEFDPKQNLFKNLKSFEQVGLE